MEIYYNTIFHELTHSTGHKSRLARPGVVNTQAMSHEYGVEELIAGMGAAMLETGRNQPGDNGVGRFIHPTWRDTIAADKSIVLKAAQQARRLSITSWTTNSNLNLLRIRRQKPRNQKNQ